MTHASTEEIATNVFAYIQAGGGFCVANAGILRGGDGTTVIDALFTPAMTRALLDETHRLTGAKAIARLVNTHHHVDHTLGNGAFPHDTEIVAHVRARDEMQRTGMGVLSVITRIAPEFEGELDGATERLPDATFDGAALHLEANGRRVRLLHFGTGHTRGDVLVYLPDDRLMFTGDVGFFGVTPLAIEGHIGNWLRIGRRIVDEIDADVLVPGHGPVGTKRDLTDMLDYLDLVHAGARRAYDAGAPREEVVRSIDLGKYAEWVDAGRIVPNVARCYAEFDGELDAIL